MTLDPSSSLDEEAMREAIAVDGDEVEVRDDKRLRESLVGPLADVAVFGEGEDKQAAQDTIRALAHEQGILEASIQPLYLARGRGEVDGFTVPAMNLRTMTYEMARAAFRAAGRANVGALVFELAPSEMGYTDQSPGEYASSVLGAAIREGHEGPVFVQGDHFQFDPEAVAQDARAASARMRDLVERAIAAGFFNIDVDASTLVDLSLEQVPDQQEPNAQRTVETLEHVRSVQPVPVSVGGEVGEVGAENTTETELRAFLDRVEALLAEQSPSIDGLSKVSVQTGTEHGGVVLPDGSLASVDVDFDTLDHLSAIAREEYGLAGCVQHGASTLPDEHFRRFPAVGACEIHLATGFLNLILDHEAFPEELGTRLREHLTRHHGDRRKAEATDEQFFYRNRKRALGAFKEELWTLDEPVKQAILPDLEERFAFLFGELGVEDSAEMVDRYVDPTRVEPRESASWFSVLAE